jgi:hypothetical protein
MKLSIELFLALSFSGANSDGEGEEPMRSGTEPLPPGYLSQSQGSTKALYCGS